MVPVGECHMPRLNSSLYTAGLQSTRASYSLIFIRRPRCLSWQNLLSREVVRKKENLLLPSLDLISLSQPQCYSGSHFPGSRVPQHFLSFYPQLVYHCRYFSPIYIQLTWPLVVFSTSVHSPPPAATRSNPMWLVSAHYQAVNVVSKVSITKSFTIEPLLLSLHLYSKLSLQNP